MTAINSQTKAPPPQAIKKADEAKDDKKEAAKPAIKSLGSDNFAQKKAEPKKEISSFN